MKKIVYSYLLLTIFSATTAFSYNVLRPSPHFSNHIVSPHTQDTPLKKDNIVPKKDSIIVLKGLYCGYIKSSLQSYDKNNVPEFFKRLIIKVFETEAQPYILDSQTCFLQIDDDDPPDVIMSHFKDSPFYQKYSHALNEGKEADSTQYNPTLKNSVIINVLKMRAKPESIGVCDISIKVTDQDTAKTKRLNYSCREGQWMTRDEFKTYMESKYNSSRNKDTADKRSP